MLESKKMYKFNKKRTVTQLSLRSQVGCSDGLTRAQTSKRHAGHVDVHMWLCGMWAGCGAQVLGAGSPDSSHPHDRTPDPRTGTHSPSRLISFLLGTPLSFNALCSWSCSRHRRLRRRRRRRRRHRRLCRRRRRRHPLASLFARAHPSIWMLSSY